jgi:hypothetical protein
MKKNNFPANYSYHKLGMRKFRLVIFCKIYPEWFVENRYLSSFATQFVNKYLRAINI